MRERAELTAERLRQLLYYDPVTGHFFWQVSRGRGKAWEMAGCVYPRTRRVTIVVDGRSYYAHRLAWLYMTGAWPKGEIDHKDRDPSNNAWDNLRDATHSQNMANTSISVANTTGYKGVYYHPRRRKFYSAIMVNQKNNFLGYHDTPQEAHAAYIRAAKEYFGEFSRAA